MAGDEKFVLYIKENLAIIYLVTNIKKVQYNMYKLLNKYTVSCLLVSSVAYNACAANGYYAGLGLGASVGVGAKVRAYNMESGNPANNLPTDLKLYSKPKSSNALAMSLVFGKEWNNGLRSELEVLHIGKHQYTRSYKWTNDNLGKSQLSRKSDALFLNTLYQFQTAKAISPYIGVGIGYAQNTLSWKAHRIDPDDDVNNQNASAKFNKSRSLALQGIVGLNYKLNEKVSFDLSYRFAHLGSYTKKVKQSFTNATDTTIGTNASTAPLIKGKIRNHVVMLSTKYHF